MALERNSFIYRQELMRMRQEEEERARKAQEAQDDADTTDTLGTIGSIAGAVIGGVAGGPAGAVQGYGIGKNIGEGTGKLFSGDVKGAVSSGVKAYSAWPAGDDTAVQEVGDAQAPEADPDWRSKFWEELHQRRGMA